MPLVTIHIILERNLVTLRRRLEEWSIERVADLMTNLRTSEQVVVLRSLLLERGPPLFSRFQQLSNGT